MCYLPIHTILHTTLRTDLADSPRFCQLTVSWRGIVQQRRRLNGLFLFLGKLYLSRSATTEKKRAENKIKRNAAIGFSVLDSLCGAWWRYRCPWAAVFKRQGFDTRSLIRSGLCLLDFVCDKGDVVLRRFSLRVLAGTWCLAQSAVTLSYLVERFPLEKTRLAFKRFQRALRGYLVKNINIRGHGVLLWCTAPTKLFLTKCCQISQ